MPRYRPFRPLDESRRSGRGPTGNGGEDLKSSAARPMISRGWTRLIHVTLAPTMVLFARVAEPADARDLGSRGETREGSSPSSRTNRRAPLLGIWLTPPALGSASQPRPSA